MLMKEFAEHESTAVVRVVEKRAYLFAQESEKFVAEFYAQNENTQNELEQNSGGQGAPTDLERIFIKKCSIKFN